MTPEKPTAREIANIKARAVIAADLYREGRITRPECFRLEMDASLGRDTGLISYETNTDYADLAAENTAN